MNFWTILRVCSAVALLLLVLLFGLARDPAPPADGELRARAAPSLHP